MAISPPRGGTQAPKTDADQLARVTPQSRVARTLLWELTGYWLLLFVGFFPQSLRPHDTVAYIGDSLDSVYTIAWTGRQVFTDPLNLFDVNVLHPHRQALALFGHRILLGVLAAPVAWLSANPVLAYNLTIAGGCLLAAFGARHLARRLGAPPLAAWAAGSLNGFNT